MFYRQKTKGVSAYNTQNTLETVDFKGFYCLKDVIRENDIL